jgi:hypothetical protein
VRAGGIEEIVLATNPNAERRAPHPHRLRNAPGWRPRVRRPRDGGHLHREPSRHLVPGVVSSEWRPARIRTACASRSRRRDSKPLARIQPSRSTREPTGATQDGAAGGRSESGGRVSCRRLDRRGRFRSKIPLAPSGYRGICGCATRSS